MGDPLLDKDFLRELDLNRNKIIYARLTSLDINENPIEYIEGRITGGSISIDGTSVVRRTCNLTLVSNNININEFYWGLSTKVNIEIGVQNTINNKYPDIIWFKQGIFVITTFNTSIGVNQSTITINGKDKGCMLNGDIAGNLPSSVDFGTIDEIEYTYEPITLQEKNYSAYTYYIVKTKQQTIVDPNDGTVTYEPYPDYELDTGRIVTTTSGGETIVLSDSYPTEGLNTNVYFGFKEDVIYYQRYSSTVRTKLKLNDIIREAVHIYGKEPYQNIVINDLEDYGLELLQYSGDKEIYMLRSVSDSQTTGSGNFEHISLDGDKPYYIRNNNNNIVSSGHTLSYFKEGNNDAIQDSRVDDWNDSATKVYFQSNGGYTKPYTVAVIAAGETTGYRMTDLVYNGDLISSVGETLTSMLDKIKNMLGDFEYFYDVDGHFIFQRKKTYINTSWNSIITSDDERFAQSLAETSAVTYSFEGNVLLTAIQQSPVLNNLKNDYSIWGNRKSITGADIPIHLRYAIHKKPKYYKAFDGKVYTTDADYAKQILTKVYSQITMHYRSPLADFEMEYQDDMPPNLIRPEKKANGLYTPGWWDIRDWARYYKLVMNTDEDPKYTMKWYSHNSLEGCVPVTTLNIDNLPRWIGDNAYCWLVTVTTNTLPNGGKRYSWGLGHGYGTPSAYKSKCYQYQSYRDPDHPDTLITERTGVEDYFMAPYNGCSDNHTYLHFLMNDVAANRNVYFYNPDFPDIEDIEAYIEEQIIEEYEATIDESLINVVDWREIIYQMAVDYYRYNETPKDEETIALYNSKGWDIDKTGDNFLATIISNSKLGDGDYLFPTGYTGYEQYYPDMQGFWRQLYCPIYDEQNLQIRYTTVDGNYQQRKKYVANGVNYELETAYIQPAVETFTCNFYLPGAYIKTIDKEIEQRGYREGEGAITYRDTRPKLDAQGNLQYNNNGTIKTEQCTIKGWSSETAAADCKYKSYFNEEYAGWARNVIDNPAALNFWIDFLDTGELGQFDVTAIGARQKVVSDNDVKCIYNKEVPDIIFVNSTEDFKTIERKTGYTYCKLNTTLDNLFSISAMGKSAKEQLDALLYEYSYCIENVTLTSIPIYYLQPNTRVFVHDDKTKIDGDYIVTKFSIPLTTNGTMSITANKAPQRIY